MNIVITGCSSGLGVELQHQISTTRPDKITALTRNQLDLSRLEDVKCYDFPRADMLINCAGTDIGGKINFVSHQEQHIQTILTTNLLAPILLSHRALNQNPDCKIVNITSTNNKQYWPNNLAYSLSKKSLSLFGDMLQVDFPAVRYLEIRLGLTRTNFNQNRYKECEERFIDIYKDCKSLDVEVAVQKILTVLFDDQIKFLEISP